MLTTLIKESSKHLDEYQIRYGLAQACLESLTLSKGGKNSILYALLTHLSKVPELHVDMLDFDYLNLKLDDELDSRAYEAAITKLDSLKLLISKLIVEGNRHDINEAQAEA